MPFYFMMNKDCFKQKLVLLPHVLFKAALAGRLVISATLFSIFVNFALTAGYLIFNVCKFVIISSLFDQSTSIKYLLILIFNV